MKKWTWRILVLVIGVPVLLGTGVVLTLLNPGWWYDQETTLGGLRVHHLQDLNETWAAVIDSAVALVKTSELYDSDWPLHLCLDDGSPLPKWWNRMMGPAFGFGYANIVVLGSEAKPEENQAWYADRLWELDRLLAHEMIHCYQFNAFGWETRSTPIWQHEGYAEIISKGNWPYDDLAESMTWYLAEIEQHPGDNWLVLPSGIGVPTEYYHHYLMVSYWVEGKGLTYRELLAQNPAQQESTQQLNSWYEEQRARLVSPEEPLPVEDDESAPK
ncbi:MAG: hypothetical protein AAF399_20840 [Bacteroidota bacterium]